MMTDKNGVELRTGLIVEITGGFFKNDNGRYVIHHSPGDEDWHGSYYSLSKLTKKNEFSTCKYNLSSWPLAPMTNSHWTYIEAKAHNEKNAQIEVIGEMLNFRTKFRISELEREKKQYEGRWNGRDYLDEIQTELDELKASLCL